jgi:hypothetical protein
MNSVQLNGFESRNQRFAITSTAQSCVVYFTLLAKKFLFNCLQEAVSRFQARFGVFLLLNRRHIHGKRIL